MVQIWNVVGPNGLDVWVGNWRARMRKSFPVVDKDGLLWLDGLPYVHDANLDVPERYQDRRLMGLVLFFGFFVGALSTVFFGLYAMTLGVMIGIAGAMAIGTVKKEDMNAYWRFNEPAQMNMADKKLTPGSIAMTGEYIRSFGTQEHIRQALESESNLAFIVAIVLGIVGVISLLASVALLYSHK